MCHRRKMTEKFTTDSVFPEVISEAFQASLKHGSFLERNIQTQEDKIGHLGKGWPLSKDSLKANLEGGLGDIENGNSGKEIERENH